MEGKSKKTHCRDERETVMVILWLVAHISMQVFDQRYEWKNNKGKSGDTLK
ncbi:hypothetical protein K439DRAFT_1640213 [Ramaria rubella]|nr:hypothetical protein K439DRAFT_1640213 [Ramaria rubella]